MLLDARGKPIEKLNAQAHLVIYVSSDEGESWAPVKPVDVPAWVKDPDVLGSLVDGDMCSNPQEGPEWYRAEKMVVH